MSGFLYFGYQESNIKAVTINPSHTLFFFVPVEIFSVKF